MIAVPIVMLALIGAFSFWCGAMLVVMGIRDVRAYRDDGAVTAILGLPFLFLGLAAGLAAGSAIPL